MATDGQGGVEQHLGATVRWPFCLITPVSILEGETESINLDGAFVSCKGSPPLDGTFSLVIEIPDRPPLKASVELAWTTLLRSDESVPTLGVYLEFVSLSDESRRFLKDFIAAHRREPPEAVPGREETEATSTDETDEVALDSAIPSSAPGAASGTYEPSAVKVSVRLHMADVARALGMEYETLKDFNPHLRGYYLPIGHCTLNVPLGLGFKLPAILQQLSRSVSRGGEKVDSEYIVQTGDTLKSIARKMGVTVNKLKKLNALDGNVVRVGQRLRVRSTKQY
jgi:LysM repeat protein